MSNGRSPPRIEGMISLKVDNLAYRTTVDDLRKIFSRYGDVGDVYIPRNPYSMDSRGFAFVRYYNERDAEDAIRGMDGRKIDGREIRVQRAMYGRPNTSRRSGRRSPSPKRRRSRSRSYSPKPRSSRDRHESSGYRRDRYRDSRSRSRDPEFTLAVLHMLAVGDLRCCFELVDLTLLRGDLQYWCSELIDNWTNVNIACQRNGYICVTNPGLQALLLRGPVGARHDHFFVPIPSFSSLFHNVLMNPCTASRPFYVKLSRLTEDLIAAKRNLKAIYLRASSGMSTSSPFYDKPLKEYRDKLYVWRPQVEVWGATQGMLIGACCAAGSSLFILVRMRQFFNLYSQHHFLATAMPCIIFPTFGYLIFQDLCIDRKIVAGLRYPELKKSFCPTCFETRGSLIQATSGVAAPLLFSFVCCAASSLSFRTYPVPEIKKSRKVLGLIRRSCGSFKTSLIFLTGAQLLVGGFLTRKAIDHHDFALTKLVSEASN
ncbi:hypothetical protein ACTXT7_014513 [Hymenolepis weldensis]